MGYKTDLEIQQEARRALANLHKGDKIDAMSFLQEMSELGSGTHPIEYAMIRRERDCGVFRVSTEKTNYTSGYTFHGALDQLRRSYDDNGVDNHSPAGQEVIQMLARVNVVRRELGHREWVMRHVSGMYRLKIAKHEDKEAIEVAEFESIFDYRAFLHGVITALA